MLGYLLFVLLQPAPDRLADYLQLHRLDELAEHGPPTRAGLRRYLAQVVDELLGHARRELAPLPHPRLDAERPRDGLLRGLLAQPFEAQARAELLRQQRLIRVQLGDEVL